MLDAPRVLAPVPLAEVVNVLSEATLRASGGPEFLARMTGVHMAASLAEAGFAIVRQAGPGMERARNNG